jgi:EAL domain-containing protein (putative c-di-GMP-specific phosphodiesterase class I)
LRRAVAREELRTFFQPIVSLDDPSRIVGAEALLRWEDAEQGWVRPADFIPVAEDSGLIVPIGKWVLREACRCATEWEGADGAPLGLSVNLSVRQLAEAGFPELVASVLEETGFEPARLGLEVTESVLLGEAEGPLRALHEIKELGVQLVLDDFGTGYSSLSYLNRLPIDVLKLDRSFIAQLDEDRSGPSRAIVASVVRMAHALGITVVAEGVETEAQREHLRALGCELAQGFLFARPMAPEAFLGQLERLAARG